MGIMRSNNLAVSTMAFFEGLWQERKIHRNFQMRNMIKHEQVHDTSNLS
jgi:hypothetical protein